LCLLLGHINRTLEGWGYVDVSYVAPQAHKIVNVALHQEYSTGIIFIFSQGGRISIMSKTNTGSKFNEYYYAIQRLC
jgi:hypothetical protein